MPTSAEPKVLLLNDANQGDVTKDLLLPLADHEVTDDEWQVLRTMLTTKEGKTAWGNAIRKGLAKIRSIVPHLFLSELPDSGRVEANMALSYRWERDEEDVRLHRLVQQFGGFIKAKSLELDIVDHKVVLLPEWETDFVVSTVDALLWAGLDPEEFLKDKIDPKAVERYCDLLRHLNKIPGLVLGSYYAGCIKKDGALPHPDCIRSWMKLPTKQTSGGSLTVHRMAVNPGTRFQFDRKVYSLASKHVPGIINAFPEGNKIGQAATGDMITTAAFLNMNPFLVKQIAAGTAIRIDVTGTKLRDDGGFTGSSYVFRNGSTAGLDVHWAGGASDDYGAFVSAWELLEA